MTTEQCPKRAGGTVPLGSIIVQTLVASEIIVKIIGLEGTKCNELTKIQAEEIVVRILVRDALEEISTNHVHFVAYNAARVTDSNRRNIARCIQLLPRESFYKVSIIVMY